MSKYTKVIAAAVGLVVTYAATFGFDLGPFVPAITSLVTAAAVWFFPNQ